MLRPRIEWGYDWQPAPVLRALSAAEQRVLRRSGGLVRTIAKRSIQPRKRAAPPGQPPTNRKGTLKRFLFYALDGNVAIVGPARLPGARGDTPEALEHGKRTVRWRGRGRRRRKQRVTIAARPAMALALKKSRQELPKLWRDAL